MRLKPESISSAPTEIKLHQKSRVLEISFDDGCVFKLTYEYLRVYTPSADALGHGPGQETLQVGKEEVTITEVKPIGNYGILPKFSDGHETGIYTWDLLYKLGKEYESLWANYLMRLEVAGHQRKLVLTR
jgi:DUF971 family protein